MSPRPSSSVTPSRLAGVLKAATALVLAGAGAAVAVLLVVGTVLPDPFATTEVDRPHAVVLAELEDLSSYQAASGRFSTVIDLEQDADYLPDAIKGERTLLVAEGDVAASVDFGGLAADGIEVHDDGSVTVHLPEPTLGEPALDNDATYVAARDRGLLDRVEDAVTGANPTDDQGLYQQAEDRLAAAAGESDLRQRARDNTEAFVTDLLGSVGYDRVTVVFDAPPPGAVA